MEVTMNKHLRNAVAPALTLFCMGAIAFGQHYTQTNLVANAATTGVPTTDSNLVNPWGMSRSSGSPWWISDNATGVATLYNGSGTKASLTVTIPAAKTGATGLPTGTIYNGNSADFMLPGGKAANFLFSTIDGLIVGWNSSAGAVATVKTTDGSSYTGLTSATVNGQQYLYAANFTKGRVDVYNSSFQPVDFAKQRMGWDRGRRGWEEGAFDDDWLPRNYVPFNVQAIGDNIVVTYAEHLDDNPFETDGPGLGFVDVYTVDGRMVQRLEHGDWLNAPWGVALAPLDFGAYSHDLLIGQFAGGGTTQSSGYIAAYNVATGQFVGLLEDASGNPISINGVWGLSFGNAASNGNDYNSTSGDGAPGAELYFAAGPNHGAGGLFGYLAPASTELTEGNDQ
jgi:uncharacterized protein (TIGR03118 family)